MKKDNISEETLTAASDVFNKIVELKVDGYTEKYMVDYTKEDLRELADEITDEEGWVEVPVDEDLVVYAMTLGTYMDYCSSRKEIVRFAEEKPQKGKGFSRTVYTKDGVKERYDINLLEDGSVHYTYVDCIDGMGKWTVVDGEADIEIDLTVLDDYPEEEFKYRVRSGSVTLYEPTSEEYRTEDLFEQYKLREMLKIKTIVEEYEYKKGRKPYWTVDFDYSYDKEKNEALKEKSLTEMTDDEISEIATRIEKENMVFAHEGEKIILFISGDYFWELDSSNTREIVWIEAGEEFRKMEIESRCLVKMSTVMDNGDGTLEYIIMQAPIGVALYSENFAPKYYTLLEDITSYSEDDQAEIMFNMFKYGTAIPYQCIDELAPTEEDRLRYHWETYEAYLVQKEYEQYKLENPDKIIKADEPVIGSH